MSQIQEQNKIVNTFKIVLVGDAGVGKSHLFSRYIKGQIQENIQPTIGSDQGTKIVDVGDNKKVKAQIWDTAGSERYRSITSTHYRQAVGAILVYDITNEQSYEHVKQWLEDIKFQGEKNIVISLIGNKIDLVEKDESNRQVQREDAQIFASDNGLLFEETSAITNQQVDDSLQYLLKEVLRVQGENIQVEDQGEDQKSKDDQKKLKSSFQIAKEPNEPNEPEPKSNCSC